MFNGGLPLDVDFTEAMGTLPWYFAVFILAAVVALIIVAILIKKTTMKKLLTGLFLLLSASIVSILIVFAEISIAKITFLHELAWLEFGTVMFDLIFAVLAIPVFILGVVIFRNWINLTDLYAAVLAAGSFVLFLNAVISGSSNLGATLALLLGCVPFSFFILQPLKTMSDLVHDPVETKAVHSCNSYAGPIFILHEVSYPVSISQVQNETTHDCF